MKLDQKITEASNIKSKDLDKKSTLGCSARQFTVANFEILDKYEHLATYRDFENVKFYTFFNFLENYMGSKIEIQCPEIILLVIKRT